MKGILSTLYGVEIFETQLAIKGVGFKLPDKRGFYLSKEDCQNIRDAKGSEELEAVVRKIKIIEVTVPPILSRKLELKFEI